MLIGYDLDDWCNYQLKLPINVELPKICHFLITGNSGSGKSHSLKYILWQIAKSTNADLWLFDFKHSNDFNFLEGTPRYRSADNCICGIEEFYDYFTNVRQGHIKNIRQNILVIDEYPSLILYLSN